MRSGALAGVMCANVSRWLARRRLSLAASGQRNSRATIRRAAISTSDLRLRRRADVLVQTVLDLEDRNDLVPQIAVLVERNDTLQRRQIRLLRVIAHVRPRDR